MRKISCCNLLAWPFGGTWMYYYLKNWLMARKESFRNKLFLNQCKLRAYLGHIVTMRILLYYISLQAYTSEISSWFHANTCISYQILHNSHSQASFEANVFLNLGCWNFFSNSRYIMCFVIKTSLLTQVLKDIDKTNRGSI